MSIDTRDKKENRTMPPTFEMTLSEYLATKYIRPLLATPGETLLVDAIAQARRTR